MQYLDAISKTTEWSLFFCKAKRTITVIQVYAPTSNAKEAEVELKKLKVLWRPTRPSRTNSLKRYPFHYRRLGCKSRKSRDTWSNRQIWPWSTKRSRSKANRALPRECTVHSKHPFLTCPSPDGQHWNQIIFFAAKDGEALYSQQKQDKELTVAQIMNSILQNSCLNWRK